ncbi:MAG: hypothetical protein OQJ95_02230 [Kangiella sp.]|jgi:hypothetical protein|nr:hypothetical protein [Kangiella sp.]MCW9029723.1 hypothetical protein [Kangiella sp.]
MKSVLSLLLYCAVGALSSAEAEHNKFQFGELSIQVPETDAIDWCPADIEEPYINDKLSCIKFTVDGLSFFGGSLRENGDIKSGLFTDSIAAKHLLDARIIQHFKIKNKDYILSHEEGIHVVRTILYELKVKDNSTRLTKLASYQKPFYNIYHVVNGVIFSGYDFDTLSPWAIYFDGADSHKLEFLGKPDEVIFKEDMQN